MLTLDQPTFHERYRAGTNFDELQNVVESHWSRLRTSLREREGEGEREGVNIEPGNMWLLMRGTTCRKTKRYLTEGKVLRERNIT